MDIQTNENLPADQADFIRRTAKELVYDSLDRWSFLPIEDTTGTGDTVGINAYENIEFYLYPNPATHTLSLKSSMPLSQPATILVFDEQGKLWKKEPFNDIDTKTISVEQFPEGVYFITIRVGYTTCFNQKFIKVSR